MLTEVVGARSLSVLHVVTTAWRRGSEVHAVALSRELARTCRSEVVALQQGPGTLPVDALGPSTLAPATLARLRSSAAAVDVVVAHGSRTLPASALALVGSPTPFVYRSIGDPQAWLANRAARIRTRTALRSAERVVALWPGAADQLAMLHGLARERLAVIPNAVEESDEPVVPPPADGSVAFVGSLTEEKRPEVALDACWEAGLRLTVAGDGPLRGGLERRAAARGQDVRFLGSVDDVDSVYDGADVLLLTSRTEGQPGVIAEAAQRARATVATTVGGVPSMIDDGRDGWLVPADAAAGDVADALAGAIPAAADVGARARITIGRRTAMPAVAGRWASLLTSVVEHR